MNDLLLHHSRSLLQQTAVIMASAPANPDSSDGDNSTQNANAFDVNTQFSPSMAIILVVLLTSFFFMAFFSIYVKRCSTRADNSRSLTNPAAPPHPATVAPPQGVDPAFLETLPLVAYSSSKKKGSNIECVVCLTDFEEGEPLCQLPRCKHVFHKDCIDMWLFSHTTCPLCRRNVVSDGTRSFRWGGGSGSLRLSIARRESRRGSGRGSAAGTGPSTPIEERARLPDTAEDSMDERRPLRRSHSTGHSLSKQAQSSSARGGLAEHVDSDEPPPSAGCLPLSMEPATFQRSRSYAAFGDVGLAQIGISGWMREAGASVKRVLSLKKVSPAGAYGASSSSSAAAAGAAVFDRISPV